MKIIWWSSHWSDAWPQIDAFIHAGIIQRQLPSMQGYTNSLVIQLSLA